MAIVPAVLLLALLAGSLAYCALVVFAARRYLARVPPALGASVPISVLKPLAGLDDGLQENLRSFFEQDYPEFEILFAVREAGDPACAVAEKLITEYPGVPARLIVTGEPPYPNAKVYSLDRMMAASRHGLLVMSDSDIRVSRDMLRVIAAEFQDHRLGIATCPYRAVAGGSFWSRLEAAGMNTSFWAGILVARLVEGARFAVGPTIAARKEVLRHIGGFDRLKDYLAEDFVMGKFAAEHGYGVELSSYVIEHRIGSQGFIANLRHRLRWARSTRRSRPRGYFGQVFTHPLPLALCLLALRPSWWPLLLLSLAFRGAAAWAVAVSALRIADWKRQWWLVPLEDLAGFLFWIAGFFGNTIVWRGRKYRLLAGGRFLLIEPD